MTLQFHLFSRISSCLALTLATVGVRRCSCFKNKFKLSSSKATVPKTSSSCHQSAAVLKTSCTCHHQEQLYHKQVPVVIIKLPKSGIPSDLVIGVFTMAETDKKFITQAMMLSMILVGAYGNGEIVQDSFGLCPRGQVSGGQQMGVVSGRSKVDCLTRCSQLAGCVGVNVCPSDLDEGVTCTLMSDHSPSGCNNLITAESPLCRFVQKNARPEPPEFCQNGGTQIGNQCVCPMQYSGTTCNRLVRDCEEVYANGYNTGQYNGVFNIQPIPATLPFQVLCNFEWGIGITYALLRNSIYDFNKNWTELRDGFGDPSSFNFFVGLENLHHLLNQAEYEVHVYFVYPEDETMSLGSAFYNNVTVGPEAEYYSLTYDSFFSVSERPADDGFEGGLPLLFSAQGQDTNGCASLSAVPGWYGPGCVTNNGLFASPMTWSTGGAMRSLDELEFIVERTSAFYE
ncbi:hypothetical protein BaRGS_00003709 [Batillaria attramentaria]|uniref:Fibrinogen C-terminal domain-containing protein n=1 Tax=Batillaria attramentaria TaxID=370345 RepID=A0ABD0M047_9CAEN